MACRCWCCACLCLLTALALPTNSAGTPQDAFFDRHGSSTDAADQSKLIAKQIKCEVCVLAAGVIAEHMEDHAQGQTRFRHEGDLLEVMSAICRGRIGQEPIDRVVEKQGWEVVDQGSGQFKMERRELEQPTQTMHELEKKYMPLKGSEFILGRHKRDSIQEACMLSVAAHASELTESLFKELMEKRIPDQTWVAETLCLKMSGACLMKKPAGDKDAASDAGADNTIKDEDGDDDQEDDDEEGEQDDEQDDEEDDEEDEEEDDEEDDKEDDEEDERSRSSRSDL